MAPAPPRFHVLGHRPIVRVIVAGGAGFLGSHLCDALLARDDEVVAIDNLCTGSLENIEHLADEVRFAFVKSDVSDRVELDGVVDAVCNLASPASPPAYLSMPDRKSTRLNSSHLGISY